MGHDEIEGKPISTNQRVMVHMTCRGVAFFFKKLRTRDISALLRLHQSGPLLLSNNGHLTAPLWALAMIFGEGMKAEDSHFFENGRFYFFLKDKDPDSYDTTAYENSSLNVLLTPEGRRAYITEKNACLLVENGYANLSLRQFMVLLGERTLSSPLNSAEDRASLFSDIRLLCAA